MWKLIFVAVLAAAAPARAMGRYVNLAVRAWNFDGSSVLVERTETSSGTAGMAADFLLISTGEPRPLVFTFDRTLDPDHATQHVSRAACAAAARQLARALAARQFEGVDVRARDCATSARAVVHFARDVALVADLSWVAKPTLRAPSPRETAAWAAAEAAGSAGDLGPVDVASLSGRLVLVFHFVNGDSSGPGDAAVYAAGKLLIPELRDAS